MQPTFTVEVWHEMVVHVDSVGAHLEPLLSVTVEILEKYQVCVYEKCYIWKTFYFSTVGTTSYIRIQMVVSPGSTSLPHYKLLGLVES